MKQSSNTGPFSALPDSECVQAFCQATGVDKRPQDVVAEVAETERDTAEMFESSVDRFDRSVGPDLAQFSVHHGLR